MTHAMVFIPFRIDLGEPISVNKIVTWLLWGGIPVLSSKEKCVKIKTENYGKKSHFKDKNIKASRNHYRARFKMQNFAGNFSKDKRFAKSNWMCKCKSSIENETHIIEGNCETYSQIRNKYKDLETEDNLVAFFSEVLEERERIEEEERSPSGGGGGTMEDASGCLQLPAGLGSSRTS